MKINELRPMLWTEDFPGTIEFYTETLGFECVERIDEYPWASLRHGGAAIMFAGPNAHEPYDKIGLTGSLYFNVEDVDAIWEELKDKARRCYDIETFLWGMREFAIYDNNGYILQFGQEIQGE